LELIGYIGFKNIPINQALALLMLVKVMLLKPIQLGHLYQNVGWIGDLTNLKPGEGCYDQDCQEEVLLS
jgi:hypothetical protein